MCPLYLGRPFPGFLLSGSSLSPLTTQSKGSPPRTLQSLKLVNTVYYLPSQCFFISCFFPSQFLSLPPLSPPEYGHHEGKDHANSLRQSISLKAPFHLESASGELLFNLQSPLPSQKLAQPSLPHTPPCRPHESDASLDIWGEENKDW